MNKKTLYNTGLKTTGKSNLVVIICQRKKIEAEKIFGFIFY